MTYSSEFLRRRLDNFVGQVCQLVAIVIQPELYVKTYNLLATAVFYGRDPSYLYIDSLTIETHCGNRTENVNVVHHNGATADVVEALFRKSEIIIDSVKREVPILSDVHRELICYMSIADGRCEYITIHNN